jgi:lipopolysaccharide transport protein LptA
VALSCVTAAATDEEVASVDAVSSGLAVAPPASTARSGASSVFGIDLDSGSPISIHADELEAVQNGGVRQLVFTKNVVVTQDDVTIRSTRLEAYYPPGASQPDRLVAQGSVRMRQGDREARCDNATFDRLRDLVVCRGDAVLQDVDGCVAGDRIEFDLAADTVTVKGGARVMINGNDGSAAEGCR